MADLATAGHAPDYYVPPINVFSYLFSNPFAKDSPDWKRDPVRYAQHCIDQPTPPQKAAFISGETGASITYARLQQDALRVAATLQSSLGLRPAPYKRGSIREPIISPVVLLHLPNGIPFVVLELAGWAAGLTVTTVNWALKPYELAHIIKESQPAVVFTTSGAAGAQVVNEALELVGDEALAARLKDGRIFTVDPDADDYGLPRSATAASEGITQTQDWKVLVSSSPTGKPFQIAEFTHGEEEARRRTALILWSSGTSGKSKGVVISHSYLTYGVKLVWLGNRYYTENEVFVGVPPFFHILGLSNILCASIAFGATTICVGEFDPELYLRVIQRYRATYLHIAPPLAIFFAKSPLVAKYDLSSVKSCISGGAPLGEAVIEAVYKRLGFWIRMSYGTSEGASHTQSIAETWDEAKLALTATGVPYPGVEIKIISTDGKNETLKRGERGELLFRSPTMLNCYLNNQKATSEAFDDYGWFHTGDVGIIDKRNMLSVVDRLKEVIKVKGFQVAPAELEALLNSHPDIADAGVSGIFSDEEQTEYPKAYIVPAKTAVLQALKTHSPQSRPSAELFAFAKSVNAFIEEKTTHYKRLKGGIVICEAIPKSNSGKILRKDFKTVTGVFVNTYATGSSASVRQSKL